VSDNVFAPPKAKLEREATEEAPALWNPNAAANWCLLFTAAFGAYLHMRNWQALGQPDRARASRNWMIAVIGVVVILPSLGALAGFPGVGSLVAFALLVTWYFVSARAQMRYVKETFGDAYPRKGWGLPLLAAFVIVMLVSVVNSIVVTAAYQASVNR